MTTVLTRPAAWTLLALGGSVLALKIGRSRRERTMRHSWEAMGFLSESNPDYADLADDLVESGLTLTESTTLECGHGNEYTLAEDAPLPKWFHEALAGAVLFEADGPWPNWGRTSHPVDWSALIDAHPDDVVPFDELLAQNGGATWPAISAAFAIARRHDPLANLSVDFWVGPDGRIQIDPMFLKTGHDLPDTVAMAIDRALVASGRQANLIHIDGCPRCEWQVNC